MIRGRPSKPGINPDVSPNRPRHAHGSHAIDGGASLPEVQATLGHEKSDLVQMADGLAQV